VVRNCAAGNKNAGAGLNLHRNLYGRGFNPASAGDCGMGMSKARVQTRAGTGSGRDESLPGMFLAYYWSKRYRRVWPIRLHSFHEPGAHIH
jgi:hypothetical protein